MIVSAHQPNFIPWLGFFEKMKSSDIMVLMDIVPYTKNHVYNRNKVLNDIWLTIPVKHRFKTPYNQVKVDQTQKWKKRHINTLKSYPTSKNKKIINQFIKEVYQENDGDLLIDYNLSSIFFLMNHLLIKTEVVLLSDLGISLENFGGSKLLYEISKKLGADTYLSGFGAATATKEGGPYLESEIFTEIEVKIMGDKVVNHYSALHNLIMGDI